MYAVPRPPRALLVALALTSALLVAAAAAACNALSGVNDLTEVGDGFDAGAFDRLAPPRDTAAPPPPPSDAHVHDFDAFAQDDASLIDAGTVDANAGLCDQLTMLLRFDGTTNSSQGQAAASATGVGFAAGKFGQALNANGRVQVDYSANAGATVSSTRGTVAMWLNTQWSIPCNANHLFCGIDDTGLYMDCEPPGYLGVYVDQPPSSSVGPNLPPASSQPVWVKGGWNHLVATWSLSPPLITITLNGSLVQQSVLPFTVPNPVAAVFHVASSGTPTLALIDDVAVWTRPLSAAEIHTVYLSTTSMGDVCSLR